ncbi:MAG: OmpP1/FadL family transporter, partial [Candidatus Aminicenantales bacterium]
SDFVGLSVKIKDWALSISHGLLEIYDRPSVEQKYYYRGILYSSLNFSQEGLLKVINFSVARKINSHLSFGLGLNLVKGHLEKQMEQKWLDDNLTLTDSKSQKFQGFYFNLGLIFTASSKLNLAAIFRSPYQKKADSHSLYRYLSPEGKTDIKIEASAQNKYPQPLVIGIGLSYKLSPQFRLASDFSYFNWSTYKITYFEEEIDRHFKNIIKVGAGIEYLTKIRFSNHQIVIPFRAGLIYDPQPMSTPNSYYLYYTLGSGFQWGKFHLNLGASFGRENGTGDSLSARKISLSLTFLM